MIDDCTTFFAFSTAAFTAAGTLPRDVREGLTSTRSRAAVEAALQHLGDPKRVPEPYTEQILRALRETPTSDSRRHAFECHAVIWDQCCVSGVSFGSNKAWRHLTHAVPLFHQAVVAQDTQILTRVADGPPGPLFYVSRKNSLHLANEMVESYDKSQSRELGWQTSVLRLRDLRQALERDGERCLAFVGWDPGE